MLYLPFFRLHPFFIILFVMMLIYILLVIAIPLITFGVNAFRQIYLNRKKTLQASYQQMIFNYLISDDESELLFLSKTIHKDILLTILYELIRYTEGTDKHRLIRLFKDLKMEDYILRKLRNPFCYRKAFYLKRIALLSDWHKPVMELEKQTSSRWPERRLYAMQALIIHQPERIIPLFKSYRYVLSLWEQVSYYDFFITRGITVPDFHPLALSSNDSIAMFGIRMVRLFHQRIGSVEGYESLLRHPNLSVQGEVFLTLAEFGYDNLASLLSDFMPRVSLQVRMNIITYLAKNRKADVPLLMDYYYHYDSSELRLHILSCIYNFMDGGKDEIMRFSSQEEDRILHQLSSHILKDAA